MDEAEKAGLTDLEGEFYLEPSVDMHRLNYGWHAIVICNSLII